MKKNKEDEKGATEDQVVRINTIKGGEALGYKGKAREEHTGDETPTRDADEDLADNRPEDLE